MIYLAVPYSHADPAVREARFEAVNRAAAVLAERGQVVFSPISMTHPMERYFNAPRDSVWWCAFDAAFMPACTELVILTVDGWDRSVGVAIEIKHFRERGLPISLLTEEGEIMPMAA